MEHINAYMNWSGGKDSALCLYKTLQSREYRITHLLTSMNTDQGAVSMHGIRRSLLVQQARSMNLQLNTIELNEGSGADEYNNKMRDAIRKLKRQGCTHAIFGDIFLEDLRAFREKKLAEENISCVFPLWKKDTRQLAYEFISLGFKSVLVCVNETYLSKSFCGRMFDEDLLNDLPDNVDPCGENGEFHTFVFDGPLFKQRIEFTQGEIWRQEYPTPIAGTPEAKVSFYFCDLKPV